MTYHDFLLFSLIYDAHSPIYEHHLLFACIDLNRTVYRFTIHYFVLLVQLVFPTSLLCHDFLSHSVSYHIVTCAIFSFFAKFSTAGSSARLSLSKKSNQVQVSQCFIHHNCDATRLFGAHSRC